MWNPEPRVAEEKGRGWSGEGRLVWVGGSRRGSKWRKMLDHDCNKKERGPERRRRRAIRPATVIRFHLNLWTLNDFPWVETACQRCVCVSVCACARERQRECVHAYISSSNPSFHRLSTPQYCTLFSLRPISFLLFRLHPATTPLCRQDGYLLFQGNDQNTHFSLSAWSSFTGLLSVSLLWLIWLVSWQSGSHSISV